jgi:hypothetical protein
MHVPLHALSQQTASTQLPSWHSLEELHELPVLFLPMQVPPEHTVPVRQSASPAQELLHAVAEAHTRLPEQEVAVPGVHVPAPQVPCGM